MNSGSIAFAIMLGLQGLILGTFLALSSAPPVSFILTIAGWLIIAFGGNWAHSSSRARRGLPNSLFVSFDDFRSLGARDWQVVLASAAIGGSLFFAGILLVSPGAA